MDRKNEKDKIAGKETMKNKTVNELARIAFEDWKKPTPLAWPYLEAMLTGVIDATGSYGLETAEDVILRFVSYAQTWTGETARLVKAELNRRCKEGFTPTESASYSLEMTNKRGHAIKTWFNKRPNCALCMGMVPPCKATTIVFHEKVSEALCGLHAKQRVASKPLLAWMLIPTPIIV